jgi:hypothetical protein
MTDMAAIDLDSRKATKSEQPYRRLETSFFKAVNQVTEPLIHKGLASHPLCWPASAIVLETTGRKTGRTYKVPLLATRVGEFLLVGTVRAARSQWLRNLASQPKSTFWLGGRKHHANAFVIGPDFETPRGTSAPPVVRCLANALVQYSRMFGVGFAILAPRRSGRKGTRNVCA